jgi:hypothetical protein
MTKLLISTNAASSRLRRREAALAASALVALFVLAPGGASAQAPSGAGTEEFGLSKRELVQAIEKVEDLVSKCMREEGFQYFAADHNTVHAGMKSDKQLPGLSEQEFINKYGFGLATLYTGEPPQLTTGYSPARVGLGERNIQYFKGLSPADQVAYNRALLGENTNLTFAVAFEMENFSNTGGCTRKSVEQVFKPDQLSAAAYNPQDALINKDPRMKAVLLEYAREMKKAGFDYTHPDEVEPDIRARLAALTNGGTLLVSAMSADQRTALKRLQEYELAAASKSFKLQEELVKPVEERIQQEMFSRTVQ